MERGPQYKESESLSVSTSAVGFTAATAEAGRRNHAFITCEVAAVRFWIDGSTPTATAGHELLPGDILKLDDSHQISVFSAISRDGSTATLRCSFGE